MDECRAGIANCTNGTVCENTLGSFQCVKKKEECEKGYFKSMGQCVGKTPFYFMFFFRLWRISVTHYYIL